MTQGHASLPPRPSLEQLRKQAKELLRQFRAGDREAVARFHAGGLEVTPDRAALADAQLALARFYGFESWPRLVHHLSTDLTRFEQLARDLVTIFAGSDPDALRRLQDTLGPSITAEQIRTRVGERLGGVAESTLERLTEPMARTFVAQMYAFPGWSQFAASLAGPATDARSAPLGMSSKPPFYQIDRKDNTIRISPPMSENDWDAVFGVMNEMGITGLDAGGQMTDAALKRLARIQEVTRIDLENCDRLTDDGLRHLSAMPCLQELNLGGWHMSITDRGLEPLSQLADLRRFSICWARQVTDTGIASLQSCARLELVNLLGTKTGDGAIATLAGKRSLRHFNTGSRVTDAGLPLLHDFPVFQRWHGGEMNYRLMSAEAEPNQLLLDGSFTNQGFVTLRGLDGLFALNLFGDRSSGFTAEGLRALMDLPHLGFLSCGDAFCDDGTLQQIAELPHLRMLLCQDAAAGDDGFAALGRSTTIEYIWGRRCHGLGDRGFRALARMPALKGLSVSCRNVPDSALAMLPDFPALREFMPMDFTDEGFRHVGHCARLEALWCMYCRETGDAATEYLADLRHLKRYYAGKTRITDRSLEILGGLQSLEQVELWHTTGVTDAGLPHLARLPRLREVTIDAVPKVSREGARVFSPQVRVTIR